MIRFTALLLCGACLFWGSVLAQDQKKVDSLQKILEHRVGFCEQFEALYELCFEYLKRDNVKALDFIQQAEVAAASSGDSLWIVKSMRVKGIVLYYLERNLDALKIFEKVLPIARRNGYERERVFIHQFVGRIYLYEGQYDKALFFFLEGLQIAINLEDHLEIATAWHDVGICYYKLRDYHQALEYYLKALEGYKFLSIHHGVMVTNIALCYANLGELEKAKEANDTATQMSDEQCPNTCQLNLKYSMGLVAMLERNYSNAERYLLESYRMAQRLRDTRFQLDNIYLITEIFVKQKNFKKAQHYLNIAEDLMRKNKSYNLEMIKIYSRFTEVHKALQDFESASFYQSKYIALRDSIYREELTNSLMKVQSEYLERENQAKIQAQREIIMLSTAVMSSQRKLNIVSVALVLLAFLILMFLFRDYRRNRRLNSLLEQKVKERTAELEAGRSQLLSIVGEQGMILRRISKDAREKINTICGLCYAVASDTSDPKARFYVTKIESTSREIEQSIQFCSAVVNSKAET